MKLNSPPKLLEKTSVGSPVNSFRKIFGCFFFSPLSAIGPIDLFLPQKKKEMDDAQTHIGPLLCASGPTE
jgi:hypothetical protein